MTLQTESPTRDARRSCPSAPCSLFPLCLLSRRLFLSLSWGWLYPCQGGSFCLSSLSLSGTVTVTLSELSQSLLGI